MKIIHEKFIKPMVKKIHFHAINYLKQHNSYSDYSIPKTAKNPSFILHTGASIDNGSVVHAEQWIPSFVESEIDFIIVTRNIETYQKLSKKYNHLSISLITSTKDADNLIANFPKIIKIFYLANTSNNFNFLRYPHKNHIFLGHGDSDKNSSMNRLFKIYDEIYVAGQAHIDRFSSAEFDTSGIKFRTVGRPVAEKLLIESSTPLKNNYKFITYLPTWEGFYRDQDYSSLNISKSLISSLIKEHNKDILVKFHPVTGLVKKQYKNIEQNIIPSEENIKTIKFINKKEILTKILQKDSIYICDISSVVSEVLMLDCPIFLFIPSDKDIIISSGKISYLDFSYTFSSIKELNKKIKSVLDGDDSLAVKRKEARNYFVSLDATKNKEFVKTLHENL